MSRPLGLAGVGRLWPSDDDDNGGGGGDDDDGESISNVFFLRFYVFQNYDYNHEIKDLSF